MSAQTTASPAAARPGLLERSLAMIERVGNKVPHPAIMFLALCLGVIVLSQLMAWAGVGATYEVVRPPEQSVSAIDVAGSVLPSEVLPSEPPRADDYEVVTETVQIEGLLTADGIRFLFTSFVPNFMGFTAMGIILIVMIGVGVAERSGLIAAAHPQAGGLVIGFCTDLHHRVPRGCFQHRLGRRLTGPDPVGSCGVPTVIALMLPYFVALAVVWTLFYLAWYLLGLPWGIGGL